MSDSPTELRPSDEEIKAMAAKAEIPEGATFSEAHVRLRVLAKLSESEADRWAALITNEPIPP